MDLFLLFTLAPFVVPVSMYAQTESVSPVAGQSSELFIDTAVPTDLNAATINVCPADSLPGQAPVWLNLTLDTQEVDVGQTITFSGLLTNDLPQALTDVQIFARVFGNVVTNSGYPLQIDEFVLADDLQVGGGSNITVSGSWKVPDNAVAGEYFVSFYVIDGDTSYMRGLPYLYEHKATSTWFTVVSDTVSPTAPYFDMSSAVVVGAKYADTSSTTPATIGYDFFSREIPTAPEDAMFYVEVVNPLDQEVEISVVWEQYANDQRSPAGVMYTKNETMVLAPNASVQASFDPASLNENRLVVSAELIQSDQSDIANKVIMAVDRARVNNKKRSIPQSIRTLS